MAKIDTKPLSSSLSRIVIAAMGLFGGVQFLTMLCSVVRIKLSALWLGTAGVGLFAVLFSAMNLISTFTTVGLRTTSVREIAAATPTDRPTASTLIRRLGVILGIFGALVMLLTAPIFSYETFGSLSHTLPFAILAVGVYLMSVTAAEQGILQGNGLLGHYAKTSLRATVVSLLLSIAALYFLRMEGILVSLLVYAVVSYAVLLRGRPASVPMTYRQAWHTGHPILRLGLYLTLGNAMTDLLSYIFVAYLTNTQGMDTVGIYQSGYTIVNKYVGLLFSSLVVEYFPRLGSVTGSLRRTRTYVGHEMMLILLLLVPVTLLFIPLAPLSLSILYSSEFHSAAPLIVACMPGMVLRAVSWCMAFVILARGDGRLYLLTETLSALIGLLLNILGYRLWGILGIGIAFTLWYAFYTLIIGVVYRRTYRLSLSPRPLILAALLLLLNILSAVVALTLGYLYALPIGILATIPALLALYRIFRK